ncbi:outer membrane lipoprotein carrier protein LolA [Shewanella olleyana]|uniref:outer membrane lipoprotein carrier protein LolA n=1 Tax=Shewanella olleyana TaxID=135626 RepID=UPI00200D23F3|nr:outer membrane lipoprotein carrier protein LolA [Shewanella olleyana]MCL1066223.1 outer membrane lipoprotein carrier protein LolA [Shewanella olleyana]
MKLLIALIFSLIFSIAISLTTASAEPIDKTEQALTSEQLTNLFTTHATNAQLTVLAQKLQLGQQAKGEFSQTRYLAVLKRPLKSAGIFIFNQDTGLLWQQTSPFASTMVLKQNTLIQQDSFGNISHSQANQVSSAMAEQLPQLMQALLTGDLDALAQDFELFMPSTRSFEDSSVKRPENSLADSGNWQLGLVAKNPLIKQAIGAMVLEGGDMDGTNQIKRLTMLSTQPDDISTIASDKTIISFTNVVQQLSQDDIQRFALYEASDTDSEAN